MRSQRGFTLIELMVVVAILGITAALVITNFKSNPSGSEARHIAGAMATAFRTAMNGGPVSSAVVSAGGPRARAMLEIKESGAGYQAIVWKLVESGSGFSWTEVETVPIAPEVEILKITDTATVDLSTTEITAGGVPATKYYYANATADPFTIYLRKRGDDSRTRYRIIGMPLSPTPQVFQDW